MQSGNISREIINIFTPMGRNCENLNYSVFLPPQQTKRVWMLLPCFDLEPQILLLGFMSPSKSSWKMMFTFLLSACWGLKSVLLWHSGENASILHRAEHFSDDSLVSEIVFCFIRDHFLPCFVCATLHCSRPGSCDGQLGTRQGPPSQISPHLYGLCQELKTSQWHCCSFKRPHRVQVVLYSKFHPLLLLLVRISLSCMCQDCLHNRQL